MGRSKMSSLLKVAVFSCLAVVVLGHGRLIEPPSRSSAWRFGFGTPENYNDNALFCGGFDRQHKKNGGKCGICGDPWDVSPRQNEAGGRYATGTIVADYKKGQIIDINVDLTNAHLGWFEFRLCPNNDVKKAATQECLDKYLLEKADGSGSRIYIKYTGDYRQDVKAKFRLPAGLTCTQCVLQWNYRTGNRWGVDAHGAGLGHGPQEHF